MMKHMKVAIIGGSGTVGGAARAALEADNEVFALSRTSSPAVDLTQPDTISAALEDIGPVDALIVAAGSASHGAVEELTESSFVGAFSGKPLGELTAFARGLPHVKDKGSITLTSGIIGRERIAHGALAAMANGALDAFVQAAATEMPRGVRLNIVSPNVLQSSPQHHRKFPGLAPVSDEAVGRAYVRSVYGLDTGRVLAV